MDDREHDERPWGSYTVLDEGVGYTTIALPAGQALDVAVGVAHRVGNESVNVPFVFIEVQRGDHLGEDDIVRLQDDYGRAGSA